MNESCGSQLALDVPRSSSCAIHKDIPPSCHAHITEPSNIYAPVLQAAVETQRKYKHVLWYTLFVAAYLVVLYLQASAYNSGEVVQTLRNALMPSKLKICCNVLLLGLRLRVTLNPEQATVSLLRFCYICACSVTATKQLLHNYMLLLWLPDALAEMPVSSDRLPSAHSQRSILCYYAASYAVKGYHQHQTYLF